MNYMLSHDIAIKESKTEQLADIDFAHQQNLKFGLKLSYVKDYRLPWTKCKTSGFYALVPCWNQFGDQPEK